MGNFKAILTAGAASCPRYHIHSFTKITNLEAVRFLIFLKSDIKMGNFKAILTAGVASCLRYHIHISTKGTKPVFNILEKRHQNG